jgi:GGDEF domain-containing protein
VVIPVGTTGDNIEEITARLQKSIQVHNAKGNRSYKLSLSAGIAYYDPENPCSVDELLAQGDKLMYEQKRYKQKS